MKTLRREKWAVFFLILGVACIEPLTHVWITHFPPEGTVSTGLHTGDSAIYLHSMASFDNGFHTPFATCQAELGSDSWRYYMTAHFLLYGAVGWLGRLFHADPLQFLGLMNGLGVAFYAWAAYRFLVAIAPKKAFRAFVLFLFSGGLGGIAYVVTGLLGLHDDPNFTENFQRLALYELCEGQNLSPILLAPRLYYALPMALGFLGLTCFIRALQDKAQGAPRYGWKLIAAAVLNGGVTAMHLRVGPLFWIIAAAYAYGVFPASWKEHARRLWLNAAATVLGGVICWSIIQASPTFQANVLSVTFMGAWVSSMCFMTFFHWPFLLRSLHRALYRLPVGFYYLGYVFSVYIFVYIVLYCLHQAYYGNWLRGGDLNAPMVCSDWALLAIVPGLLLAHATRRHRQPANIDSDRTTSWLFLWFIICFALSISAFGGGWFLKLTPQRLMVLLPIPLALLTVQGLDSLPRSIARLGYGVLIGAGLTSAVVASLAFQGPLFHRPGDDAFSYHHYEVMQPDDAMLMEALPPGTVLPPAWTPMAFGEIVSLRPDTTVLGGPGAMNLCDQFFGTFQETLARFYEPETTMAERERIVREWCIDTIYVPATCTIPALVVEALLETPWLHVRAKAGDGYVFEVALDGKTR
jgi:hypothetical protein